MLDFKRLSIIDPTTKGDQPFRYELESRTIYVMCNGEIYEHEKICEKYGFTPTSGSDCEVILLYYLKFGENAVELMSKEFNSEHAFVIIDIDMHTGDYTMFLSEDRYGIRPLFISYSDTGFYFSSELKGLPTINDPNAIVERFKPRHYAILKKTNGILTPLEYFEYYNIKSCHSIFDYYNKGTYYNLTDNIKNTLTNAVIIRLHSNRPLGCLLSGGLDSSLVSAIAAKYLKSHGQILQTFSIGMAGGTDEYTIRFTRLKEG